MQPRSATILRYAIAAILGTSAIALALLLPSTSFAENPTNPAATPLPINHDPAQTLGPDTCAECHTNEHAVWMNTGHAIGAQTLTRNKLAKDIASTLGVRRIKTDDRCASCHYTVQQSDNNRLKSIAGASCESCHSAAASWVKPHADFGPDAATAAEETPEHRAHRLQYSDSMGMIRPASLYQLASACYTCHSITDEELIAAGHPEGTNFEFASWTQGNIRHNFTRDGADNNPPSDPSRLRVMYLVGTALRLEHAAANVASGAPTAAINAPLQSLQEIQRTTNLDILADLITTASTIDSPESATLALPIIKSIAASISAHSIGAHSESIDPFIPSPYTESQE